jgi:DDE superfamily endonuclease
MELVLRTYERIYNPQNPVVCFDERPCYLIDDVLTPLPMVKGKVMKEHYAYQKNGSCCLLMAIEPKTGKRLGSVTERRTGKDFTEFFQSLSAFYPEAERITVVLDNLNTHSFSSFYLHLPAADAEALSKRFEFVYTPKSASWLNMVEIEFSALSRQCLNRRIGSKEKLEKEVLALIAERMQKGILINWQFTTENAREKLNRHYTKVNPMNDNHA